MEIWLLERASEKIKFLKNIREKGKGVVFGHKRGDAFIVEDLLPLKRLNLDSEKFISSVMSERNFIGFFSFEEKGFENIPQLFYGSVILKILLDGIKGYFVEFDEKNIPKMIELSVKVLGQEGKSG